ncbi:MAG TPA: lipocalin family protein [Chitinophagales bacterium]|nr:lipocalin family protein [Chitinophagales bacterium]
MKKLNIFLIAALILVTVTQCNQKTEKITGIWQLQSMTINGTLLQGNALGNWLWEFNDKGGYLSDIAGIKEKGLYKIKDNKLTLQPVGEKAHAQQTYTIEKLDSLEMTLSAVGGGNKSILRFLKTQAEGVQGDKD